MTIQVNEKDRLNIEIACQRLVTAYCHYVDHGQASNIADLFTEDGIWQSTEATMQGKVGIRAGFQIRQDNTARMSRHVCNNFLLTEVAADEAKGTVYLTLYRHDGKVGRNFSPLNGPSLVGEYRDHFVRTDEGWRIKHRQAIADFVRLDGS